MIDKERFWSKVDIKEANECWEWKAYLRKGYGAIRIDTVVKYAHRVAWELTNGHIPEGKLCLHNCDNKSCVNPNHLYLGTQSDNMCDKVERYPSYRDDCRIAGAKFYEGEIWLIRKLKIPDEKQGKRKKYKISSRTVAKMFKTSFGTILRIWNFDKYPCREGYLC